MTQSYPFDNMGNRLTKTEDGTTETYGYNAANMLVSRNGQPYVNDLNGNTLSGGGRTNTWDSQNRLVQCVSGGNTSQFVYGADGLRRTSVVNGTPTHYALDNGMLVREFSATLQPTATYLPGPRGVEYRRDDATGQTMWYLYDGLGSVLAEIDALGNMTTPRKYDVYGLVRAGDSGTSRHKFVGSLGHTSEDETGLIYMRARWMDPSLGRFISEDPARDGANWFEYCRGNPVNAVDRDGRASEYLDLGGGYWLRLDTWYECGRNADGTTRYMRDAHYGYRGDTWGSIRQDGVLKHGKFMPNARMQKALKKRGWALAAVSSVDAYLQVDPLDCIAILLDASGLHEEAAGVDRMNGSL